MQHNSNDPLYHDPFDNSSLIHDLGGVAQDSSQLSTHHDALAEPHSIGGVLDHISLGNFDPQHAGLADILQLFNMSPISNLIQALHNHQAGDVAHSSLPVDLGPLSHIIDIIQSPTSHPENRHSAAPDVPPLQHFQPAASHQSIIGDPAADMASWYHQISHDTCAVASQGFIIESITGQHIPENVLTREAQQNGWYWPGVGTPMYHVGDLLETHGIHVMHKEGASLADIANELHQHQKVIVGVNGEDFWYHGTPEDPLSSFPGIPGQHADHAVEVIGINDTQPDRPLVIINDPGSPEGKGLEIPADIFYQAWSTSGYYMVATTTRNQTSDRNSSGPTGLYGGYYNADGIYHYNSDNTDRGPQTGAIIRRFS